MKRRLDDTESDSNLSDDARHSLRILKSALEDTSLDGLWMVIFR